MLWDHTAYCRKCKRRVFVAPRRYAIAGDRLLMLVTFGAWALVQWYHPRRFGRWQCDECGSLRCVWSRKVKTDENGRHLRKRKRKRTAQNSDWTLPRSIG